MGRGSVRQNKNKFQLIREDLGLSREKAAELLETEIGRASCRERV